MSEVPGPFILGIDLGKAQDHTALVLAEPSKDPEPVYDLTFIERVPLKQRYTDIAQHVKGIVAELRTPVKVSTEKFSGFAVVEEKRPELTIVLDFTGVGVAVAEIFLSAGIDCQIALVTITSGGKVTWDEVGIHVPKADLVSVVQRLLQEERLRYAEDDTAAEDLVKELGDFQAIIRPSGTVAYGVAMDWREGQHDDLVLASALAVWWGESAPRSEVW